MSHARPTIEESTAYAKSYLKKNCQTTAFKAAFPTTRMKGNNLHRRASEFHHLPENQARIKELEEVAREVTNKEFGYSIAKKMEMLKDIYDEGMKPKIIISDGVVHEGNACGLPSCVAVIDTMCKIDGDYAAVKHAIGGDKDAPPIEVKKIPTDPVKAAALYSDMLSED